MKIKTALTGLASILVSQLSFAQGQGVVLYTDDQLTYLAKVISKGKISYDKDNGVTFSIDLHDFDGQNTHDDFFPSTKNDTYDKLISDPQIYSVEKTDNGGRCAD